MRAAAGDQTTDRRAGAVAGGVRALGVDAVFRAGLLLLTRSFGSACLRRPKPLTRFHIVGANGAILGHVLYAVPTLGNGRLQCSIRRP